MSWDIEQLKTHEALFITAYRKNLIDGFVDGKDIIRQANGISVHMDQGEVVAISDFWSDGNPSMGNVRITYRFPDRTEKVAWGMNYSDACLPNSYVSRKQILNFLRDAIRAYDGSGLPFRGQDGFWQALPHPLTGAITDAISLRYQIHSADKSTPTFDQFSIVEKVILDVKNRPLEDVFVFAANGGYLNLK